jgi:hypothetical protein
MQLMGNVGTAEIRHLSLNIKALKTQILNKEILNYDN